MNDCENCRHCDLSSYAAPCSICEDYNLWELIVCEELEEVNKVFDDKQRRHLIDILEGIHDMGEHSMFKIEDCKQCEKIMYKLKGMKK